jgi:crossover junction endodeoxyribonuclease RuvC
MAQPGKTIFFGIDPGTSGTGYGVVSVVNNTVRWVNSGVICPPRTVGLEMKLEWIFDRLCDKLSAHSPSCVCIEQAFYGKNARTALVLGLARGITLLAARKSGAAVVEFSPLEIKKSVVGNGNATKEQVAFMIKTLLSPPISHERLDAYDALAAALCAFYHSTGYPAGNGAT